MELAVFLVLALFALALAGFVLVAGAIGALAKLAFAAEQGFIGIAAYLACWVFMPFIMLPLSVLVGAGILFATQRTAMA